MKYCPGRLQPSRTTLIRDASRFKKQRGCCHGKNRYTSHKQETCTQRKLMTSVKKTMIRRPTDAFACATVDTGNARAVDHRDFASVDLADKLKLEGTVPRI